MTGMIVFSLRLPNIFDDGCLRNFVGTISGIVGTYHLGSSEETSSVSEEAASIVGTYRLGSSDEASGIVGTYRLGSSVEA